MPISRYKFPKLLTIRTIVKMLVTWDIKFESIWFSLSARQRKLVIWALSLLVAYTIIGFLILPPIIRVVAVRQIAQQIDRKVSIQKVKLNPFALSATVDGLLIKDKDGQPFVSWDEVYVNFQLSSFFGKAWVFKEISTTKPFVRAQMNQDGTFNFSDLITKFSTNTAPAKTESKPPILHVGKLQIVGATVGVADLTARRPYKRVLGPLNVTLENFRTDPNTESPYSFFGTTDTGEQYAWKGNFSLDPLGSQGEIAIYKVALNKYAPLYQDFVKFEIRDGSIALHANYQLEIERDKPGPGRHEHGVRPARFQARRSRRQRMTSSPTALFRRDRREHRPRNAAGGNWLRVSPPVQISLASRKGEVLQCRRNCQTRRHRGQCAGRHFVSAALRHQRRRHAAQQHEPVARHGSRRGFHELRVASGRPGQFTSRKT